MAITHVETVTDTLSSTSGPFSFTPTAVPQAGDLLIFVASRVGGDTRPFTATTVPFGWISEHVGKITTTGGEVLPAAIALRIAGNSEPATYNFTLPGTIQGGAALSIWRPDTAINVEVVQVAFASHSSSVSWSLSGNTINTAKPGKLVSIWSGISGTNFQSQTAGVDWTIRGQARDNLAGCGIADYDIATSQNDSHNLELTHSSADTSTLLHCQLVLSEGSDSYLPILSGLVTTTTSADPTLNKPSDLEDGDDILVGITTMDEAETVTPPADWTLEADESSPSGGRGTRVRVYRKSIATASAEPASYTWSFSGGFGKAAFMFAVKHISSIIRSTAVAKSGGTTASFTHSAPAITANQAGAVSFDFIGVEAPFGGATFLPNNANTYLISRDVGYGSYGDMEIGNRRNKVAGVIAAESGTTSDDGDSVVVALLYDPTESPPYEEADASSSSSSLGSLYPLLLGR